jgi:ABC-type Fe3+/spermidine/putrescine transport system ATPase subunit
VTITTTAAPGPTVAAPDVKLHIRSLTKNFGDVEVLRSIDLDVEQGEFLTLLGPSGSGKTTLLRIIAGFENATSGVLRLGDVDLGSLTPSERQLGMVFQNYALFPHLTVEENVAYGLKVRGVKQPTRSARVREMLEVVGLEQHASRKPSQLSGGQQQRVALARALAYEPEILLMDEPLGALDRSLRLQMENEIKRVHRKIGTTIIYVTHDQEEALVLSDRVAIMNQGVFAGLDTPMSLFHTPPNSFVARFFSDANLFDGELDRGRLTVLGQTVEVGSGLQGPVSVAVRPSGVRVGGAAGATADRPGIRLVGTVSEHNLLGETEQLEFAVPGHGTVVARRLIGSDRPVALGDEVQLLLDRDALVVMPD